MKKVSKIIAVTCMLTMTLMSLTACGSGNTTTETTQASTEAAAETTTEAAETVETAETATETATIEGLVWEASMNSIQIQVEDGTQYFFTMADDCTTDLADGVLLGAPVAVTYTGNLDDGTATAVALGESSLEMSCPTEAYAFAMSTINAIAFMDQDGFADALAYPTYMNLDDQGNGVEIASKDDFLAMDETEVFTEAFCMINDVNLFGMTKAEAGYVVYLDDSHAGFTFVDQDGTFAITGFSVYE
ncbi:MAG: hypothetical protein PHP50_00425 [Lachnospiraceae bacterium]|nr:hypothetical protein [Lachnospiraceae bacterium]